MTFRLALAAVPFFPDANAARRLFTAMNYDSLYYAAVIISVSQKCNAGGVENEENIVACVCGIEKCERGRLLILLHAYSSALRGAIFDAQLLLMNDARAIL